MALTRRPRGARRGPVVRLMLLAGCGRFRPPVGRTTERGRAGRCAAGLAAGFAPPPPRAGLATGLAGGLLLAAAAAAALRPSARLLARCADRMACADLAPAASSLALADDHPLREARDVIARRWRNASVAAFDASQRFFSIREAVAAARCSRTSRDGLAFGLLAAPPPARVGFAAVACAAVPLALLRLAPVPVAL